MSSSLSTTSSSSGGNQLSSSASSLFPLTLYSLAVIVPVLKRVVLRGTTVTGCFLISDFWYEFAPFQSTSVLIVPVISNPDGPTSFSSSSLPSSLPSCPSPSPSSSAESESTSAPSWNRALSSLMLSATSSTSPSRIELLMELLLTKPPSTLSS